MAIPDTIPASESESTALSVQPDSNKAKDDFKIADVFDDGKVTVALPDGRHVLATVEDGVEVHRRGKVDIKYDGDYENVVVTKSL